MYLSILLLRGASIMGRNTAILILIVGFSLMGVLAGEAYAEEIILPVEGGSYHMISSPVLPENPDPKVSLKDDLGPYRKIRWRLFRYDTIQGKYVELTTPDWGPEHDFDFGRGYWIISKNPTDIDIQGDLVGNNWIILEHEGNGWNQIGNIFDYDFPIAGLYVARESAPLDQRQLIDANVNDLTYVTLQDFDNGSYADIPTVGKNNLEVGKGYWLRVNEGVGEDVILYFVVRESSVQSEETYLSEQFLERLAQQEDPPNPPPGVASSSSVSLGGGSGGGGCFIATATYGKYSHPNVQILRKLRDRYLTTNGFGRIWVDVYYRYSPAAAKLVARNNTTKALVRFILVPIVGMSGIVSKMDIYGFFIFLALPLLGSLFLLKKGAWETSKL
jgi:hypothetical protein